MKYFHGILTGFLMTLCFVLITGSEHHKPKDKKVKLTQFKVVSAVLKEKLEDKVETHLKEGWRLRGDLVSSELGSISLMQAMVK